MFRYAIYARKSDDDTSVTEKSIGEQLLEADGIAARASLEVVWRKTESKSAKIPDVRPVWRDLVALIEDGTVDSIICWHVNRLVRNMKEGGHLVQLLIDGKIKEIRTPHACYRSGENILPIVLEAAQATQYSLDLTNTVKRSMLGNFKSGGCNHLVRPGYRNARDPLNRKKGIVERDGHRFDLIRKGWDLVLTGNHTVQEIWRRLNDEFGFRTRPTRRGGNGPLGKTTLYSIFRDPFYAGFVRYKGEVTHGRHEPMVSVEEFQKVQTILDRSTFQAPRSDPHAYAGMMRCAYCSYQITAERRKLRNGSEWQGYHCSDAKLVCTKQGLSSGKVEERIIEVLGSVTIDAEAAQLAVEEIERALDSQAVDAQSLHDDRVKELELVEERLRNLAQMWIGGLMTDPKRYRELEQAELKAKESLVINQTVALSAVEHMRANAKAAGNFVTFAHDYFIANPPERRREIAMELAIDYTFYGREKRIDVEVRPILSEFVKFSRREEKSLEPSKTGFEKQNEPSHVEAVHFGGPERNSIELPPQLVEALRGEAFRDFSFGNCNDSEAA